MLCPRFITQGQFVDESEEDIVKLCRSFGHKNKGCSVNRDNLNFSQVRRHIETFYG